MLRIKFFLPALLALLLFSCKKDDSSTSIPGTILDNAHADYTVTSVQAQNAVFADDPSDYYWDAATEILIELQGTTISASGAGVTIDGAVATITAGGNYRISGTLDDGQIVVQTTENEIVRLILDQVSIHHATGSALYVAQTLKAILVLADGTENSLTDGASYQFASGVTEPNATLFSNEDLTITGTGKLTVDGNYNDAISGQDGLILDSGIFVVEAADDGIRGKDYLYIKAGSFTVDADGDALRSDNSEGANVGYVYIKKGSFTLTAGADGIQGATDVLIESGEFDITTGGGSSGGSTNNTAKGIKAGVHLVLDGGIFTLNTADDALHSNFNITLNGPAITAQSKDDGFHADTSLAINSGVIAITKSFEGLESRVIFINGGEVRVTATDDGINIAGGADGSGGQNFPGGSALEGHMLVLNGGHLVVTAAGDGLDSNGSMTMTGGTVIVHGPTVNNNAAIDYNGSFKISGGFLIAVGSSRMAQTPESDSEQNSLMVTFPLALQAGTLMHLESAGGNPIFSFKPTKAVQNFVFSAPELTTGTTFKLYTGGSETGVNSGGLITGGAYTLGTLLESFTASAGLTSL